MPGGALWQSRRHPFEDCGVWYMFAAIWLSYAGVIFESDTPVISFVHFTTGLIALTIRMIAFWSVRVNGDRGSTPLTKTS